MHLRRIPLLTLTAALALPPIVIHAAETTVTPTSSASAIPDKKAPDTAYLRYEKGPGKSHDFELLVREFHNAKTGKTVTLAGMVHVADPAFYAKIDAIADKQDIVLLEGLNGGGFGSPGIIPLAYQMCLGERLMAPANLSGQMDYLRAEGGNRHNADVDVEEILDGASGFGFGDLVTLPVVVALGEVGYTLEGLTEQFFFLTGNTDALTRKSRALIAKVLTKPDADEESKNEAEDRLVIGHRNEAVLKVLDEELKKTDIHTVLVPWGAAHQPGLEKALLERGFVPAGDTWLRAIAVKSLATSKESDPGFRYRFPYLLSIKNSNTEFEFDAPLSLISTSSSPRVKQTFVGWGVLHLDRETDTDLFAIDALGILRVREENHAEKSKRFSVLLGLYGDSASPERNEFHFGWWSFLGGASEKREHEKTVSSEWHLPFTFGKFPLIYGQKTDAVSGKTEHRFLLFFKTTSGK